jgi:hypothetical protein
MHNLACFTKNFKFCISTHVYTKSNSVHVVMFCIYTQKVEIFHITCMMTHGLWRVKNILHVNACFKKLLANTRVSVTIAFVWEVKKHRIRFLSTTGKSFYMTNEQKPMKKIKGKAPCSFSFTYV